MNVSTREGGRDRDRGRERKKGGGRELERKMEK